MSADQYTAAPFDEARFSALHPIPYRHLVSHATQFHRPLMISLPGSNLRQIFSVSEVTTTGRLSRNQEIHTKIQGHGIEDKGRASSGGDLYRLIVLTSMSPGFCSVDSQRFVSVSIHRGAANGTTLGQCGY